MHLSVLRRFAVTAAFLCCVLSFPQTATCQQLESILEAEPASRLADEAKLQGDAKRGAIVFFQSQSGCAKCHSTAGMATKSLAKDALLGPDLASLGQDASDVHLVESILYPSKVIRDGYAGVSVLTSDGRVLTGILREETADGVALQVVGDQSNSIRISAEEIDELLPQKTSMMPDGQVNLLGSRQAFLDLVKYLMELRDGGAERASQLKPDESLLTFRVEPYESELDHVGFISDWDENSFARGEAIYNRVCVNCHGTVERAGSLPTSLRFADGKFKNGSDPHSMYRTLTYGFGFMTAQSWMVPIQKYDVIHYIREAYLKPYNRSQYGNVDEAYLASLPTGNERGPEPSKIVPWSAMNYGPTLTHTYQVPGAHENFAYKGVAVRLDSGAGGVSRGRYWTIFDIDTMRTAAAWHGSGTEEDNFIDWKGIQFNGAHGIHPSVVGDIAFANASGPGWASPGSERFVDDQRVLGRDGKRYGPLPRDWARYRGMYHHGQNVVFSYMVGDAEVLESPQIAISRDDSETAILLRTINIGPRKQDLLMQVAQHDAEQVRILDSGEGQSVKSAVVKFGPSSNGGNDNALTPIRFDGDTYLEVTDGSGFDLTEQDFSIVAKIRTMSDGTIFAKTSAGSEWVADGQALFIRGGRLAFDVGWVGALAGKANVADGKWHEVRASWRHRDQRLSLYVDGRLDGQGVLAAKRGLGDGVVRIGFTTADFPRESSFVGEMESLCFSQTLDLESEAGRAAQVCWNLGDCVGQKVADISGRGIEADVRREAGENSARSAPLLAGFEPRHESLRWEAVDDRLLLRVKAGDAPVRFTVWQPVNGKEVGDLQFSDFSAPQADRDLGQLLGGGPARWPEVLTTEMRSSNDGPASEGAAFATDILEAPKSNPWLARARFTGLDFYSDGRLAVCSWDGDVWLVDVDEVQKSVSWRRIASGMFQPLGLRIVDEKIHVTCRDQLVILHDLNGDDEIDFYECLNNDHQVTEHFHEFAMGLQTDAAGNFYYAKSGQHGLPAVVPHHGTLLKVSKDGLETTILANGFRAANGVCLNPDGSFFVTDQEGFWNPKNRINWVKVDSDGKPRFYGNMLGYHDVKDESDDAMEPPLCWITNAFDRSPGELLWVDSEKWGPLDGALLNLSYGYGKVFLVPHQRVGERMQGGMIELPIKPFPTGVMRGRFHPLDQHLYLCGMFAWAGDATEPGGLYRLRPTGEPMRLPTGLRATEQGIELTFSESLDPDSVRPDNVQIKVWSIKRTANYGSKHYDEHELEIVNATLGEGGKTVLLDVSDLAPTWCMEIKFSFRGTDNELVQGVIHNTIHELSGD